MSYLVQLTVGYCLIAREIVVGGVDPRRLLILRMRTYTQTHQADFGLDEDGMATFQALNVFLLWLLAGLVVAEVVRFQLSGP